MKPMLNKGNGEDTKELKNVKENFKGRYRISLRIYMALVSIFTLCFSCLVSFFLVFLFAKIFYEGKYTLQTTTWMSFFVCVLTMIIGAFLMFQGSYHLTKPLAILTDAVQKIAKGNFDVHIQRKKEMRKEYRYTNEIDELSENFNQMARELNSIQMMRKDFISNVSHELKTPVFAITGISELLIEDRLSVSEKKEYLCLLHEESQRLSRLCEHMLQLSRLEHVTIPISQEEFRVDEQIRQAVILLSEKWQEKEVDFQLELQPLKVMANRDLFMQIWINLIDNAMKYTKDSAIIEIQVLTEGEELVVTISDNGIGIEEDKINKIFDQFYQCEESHKKNGSGLGLSIVKRIVEIYNGDIKCVSRVNIGTTMYVKIPMRKTKGTDL